MGRNAKIRTVRKALKAEQEAHPAYANLSDADRAKWLSRALRDTMAYLDRKGK